MGRGEFMRIKLYTKDYEGMEVYVCDLCYWNWLGCFVWASIGFLLGIAVAALYLNL